MKNIAIRAGSGAVFVAVLIGSTLISKLAIGAVFTVVAFIAIKEMLQMLNNKSVHVSSRATYISAIILFMGFGVSMLNNDSRFLIPAIAMGFIYPFIDHLIFVQQPSFTSAIISAGIPIYAALPLILLIEAANINTGYQPYLLLGIFLITWTYDTFAYLVGTAIGKRRLLERVSPKKSVEGLAGGAIAALILVGIYSSFNNDLSLIHWLILTLIVVVFGTLGDLTESVLKRNCDVKDSGSIMPGHGGILDRIDALLFIGPAAYTYLLFAVN